MKTLPTFELSVTVPRDIVASLLLDRSKDPRVASASRLFQHESGESRHSVIEIDRRTIEESLVHNGWLGETHASYRYSLDPIDDSVTKVSIRTTYKLPWMLRSVFSWPVGSIVAQIIASYAATTTVSDLVALEHGQQCQAMQCDRVEAP
ncbi:MAG: hypothetical protein AAGG48_30075 [Planctomycetota bacterium]